MKELDNFVNVCLIVSATISLLLLQTILHYCYYKLSGIEL